MSTIGARKLWQGALLALALGAILAVFLILMLPPYVAGQSGTPAKPTGLRVSTTDGSLEASVDWNDVSGATSYRVRWREHGPGKALNDGITVEDSSADITVAESGEWIVRVEACNADGCGRGAAKRFAVSAAEPEETPTPTSTPQSELSKPTGLSVRTADGSLVVTVDWNDVSGATSYVVRWREQDTAAWDHEVSVNVSRADIEVDGYGQWEVQVEACASDSCGDGATQLFEVKIVSVCQRTAQVRNKLVRLTRKDCEDITYLDLGRVQYLVLPSAGITSLQAGDFNGLSNLISLYLYRNRIAALPDGVFDGLSKLRYLDLGHNRIRTVPEDAFDGLTRLERLSLDFNPISTLPEDVFDGLTRLSFLELTGASLNALPEDVFDGLTNLRTLQLTGNDLTTLPEDVFDGLTRLKSLQLLANDLTALPADTFDGLDNLETLWLTNNEMTVLPPDLFDGLSKLKVLLLTDNPLVTLPEGIFDDLSNLETLQLGGNRLSTLPDGVFDSLTKLKALHMNSNDLLTLPEDAFTGPTGLQELYLHNNDLVTLPEDIFLGLTSIRDLRLYGNPGAPFDLNLPTGKSAKQ